MCVSHLCLRFLTHRALPGAVGQTILTGWRPPLVHRRRVGRPKRLSTPVADLIDAHADITCALYDKCLNHLPEGRKVRAAARLVKQRYPGKYQGVTVEMLRNRYRLVRSKLG